MAMELKEAQEGAGTTTTAAVPTGASSESLSTQVLASPRVAVPKKDESGAFVRGGGDRCGRSDGRADGPSGRAGGRAGEENASGAWLDARAAAATRSRRLSARTWHYAPPRNLPPRTPCPRMCRQPGAGRRGDVAEGRDHGALQEDRKAAQPQVHWCGMQHALLRTARPRRLAAAVEALARVLAPCLHHRRKPPTPCCPHTPPRPRRPTHAPADPSYIIRSSPANASDSNLCTTLAFNCVHGAMGGYTGACAAPRRLAQCVCEDALSVAGLHGGGSCPHTLARRGRLRLFSHRTRRTHSPRRTLSAIVYALSYPLTQPPTYTTHPSRHMQASR